MESFLRSRIALANEHASPWEAEPTGYSSSSSTSSSSHSSSPPPAAAATTTTTTTTSAPAVAAAVAAGASSPSSSSTSSSSDDALPLIASSTKSKKRALLLHKKRASVSKQSPPLSSSSSSSVVLLKPWMESQCGDNGTGLAWLERVMIGSATHDQDGENENEKRNQNSKLDISKEARTLLRALLPSSPSTSSSSWQAMDPPWNWNHPHPTNQRSNHSSRRRPVTKSLFCTILHQFRDSTVTLSPLQVITTCLELVSSASSSTTSNSKRPSSTATATATASSSSSTTTTTASTKVSPAPPFAPHHLPPHLDLQTTILAILSFLETSLDIMDHDNDNDPAAYQEYLPPMPLLQRVVSPKNLNDDSDDLGKTIYQRNPNNRYPNWSLDDVEFRTRLKLLERVFYASTLDHPSRLRFCPRMGDDGGGGGVEGEEGFDGGGRERLFFLGITDAATANTGGSSKRVGGTAGTNSTGKKVVKRKKSVSGSAGNAASAGSAVGQALDGKESKKKKIVKKES